MVQKKLTTTLFYSTQVNIFVILILLFSHKFSNSQQKHWHKDSLKIDSIYKVAVNYSNTDPKRAGKELEKLISLIDDTLIPRFPEKYYVKSRKAISQHFLAYYKRRDNKFDESLDLLLKSIELKKEIKDTLTVPKSLNQIGMLWMYQEEFSHAEKYLKEALQLSRDYNTTSETLSILSNLGLFYQHQKNITKHKKHIKKLLKLLNHKVQNRTKHQPLSITGCI